MCQTGTSLTLLLLQLFHTPGNDHDSGIGGKMYVRYHLVSRCVPAVGRSGSVTRESHPDQGRTEERRRGIGEGLLFTRRRVLRRPGT